MRRIEDQSDVMRGTITYELDDGRYITVDARTVQRYGLREVLTAYGIKAPEGRIPVFQRGVEIGSVPADFEPCAVKPTTVLYEVRPGDFKRIAKGWEACRTLGPGDLDAVPEFQRKEQK